MDRESQRARDVRLDALWKTLDTRKEGHLDFEGLKNGFQRIDHRELALLARGAQILTLLIVLFSQH